MKIIITEEQYKKILIKNQLNDKFVGSKITQLLEKSKKASHIREMVRDIITIFKKEDKGEFYLPEEFDEERPYYELPSSVIALELIIETSNEVENYFTNANFYKDEDVIVVKIIYNPNKKII